MTERRDVEKLCSSLYSVKQLHTEPILHGRAYEATAKQKFEEIMQKKIQPCGLFIDVQYPFLAASPDGIILEEDALVEVKCPFTGRQDKISPRKKFPFLEKVGAEVRLKQTHQYYYQIIAQLHASRRTKCYFIVYTFNDLYIETVHFNTAVFNEILPRLQNFYYDHYCPYVSRQL